MPLVRIDDRPTQQADIKDAAHILWRASTHTDMNKLCNTLAADFSDPSLAIKDLHSANTGIRGTRRAVLVHDYERIVLAFEGSHPDDLYRNMWTDGKGPGWWELPYPVYTDGSRVHSFYRDMWHDMRAETFDALSKAVVNIASKGKSPQGIVVAGFSMGGGISILAFMEIIEYIRSSFGVRSSQPQDCAKDENLGSLIQHLTFAAVGAGDQGFYSVLNNMYERYGIRAWDFVHYDDVTRHVHHSTFRAWRGHRYILPDAVVQHYKAEFGPQNHFIAGYLKAAEWMMSNGTDQLKSTYSY